jgi:hypothetical protein
MMSCDSNLHRDGIAFDIGGLNIWSGGLWNIIVVSIASALVTSPALIEAVGAIFTARQKCIVVTRASVSMK